MCEIYNLLFYQSLAALMIFIISIAPLYFPRYNQQSLIGESLASGIFLGAALFHMLPDAIHIFSQVQTPIHSYPVPEAIMAFGFLLLLFLEHFGHSQTKAIYPHAMLYFMLLSFTLHAITEGFVLGMRDAISETIMIFIAILVHKASESYALCVLLTKNNITRQSILMIATLFALMTPIGIFSGNLLKNCINPADGEIMTAFIDAFAAGTFLYISTIHHFHHQKANPANRLRSFIYMLFGALTMSIIAIWT